MERLQEPRRISRGGAGSIRAFNAQAFLDSLGMATTTAEYGRGATIFTQGDACEHVLYIQTGGVTLSVRSKIGREAVVATLGPGDFFGERCLAGQRVRRSSATAITPCVVLIVGKNRMARLLRKQHAMSDRFIAHMLSRNIRIQEDLLDRLFRSSEQRLAGALLLLARYGTQETPARAVPKVSHGTLAEMVGTTPSRVNILLERFKRQGFIEYDDDSPFTINSSLLRVVLHDGGRAEAVDLFLIAQLRSRVPSMLT